MALYLSLDCVFFRFLDCIDSRFSVGSHRFILQFILATVNLERQKHVDSCVLCVIFRLLCKIHVTVTC